MRKSILIFFLISFCSPEHKIKDNFHKYQKTLIEKSEFAPTEEKIKDEKEINIAILDFDFSGVSDDQGRQDAISKYATNKLATILSRSSYIKTIDRGILNKTKEEFFLKELNGNIQYSGPTEAEYAIYGKITNISFSSELDSRSGINVALGILNTATIIAGSGRNNIIVNTATPQVSAVYNYTSVVEGEVKIVDLKTLKEILKIPFKEIAKSQENASVNNTIKPAKTFDLKMITGSLEKVFINSEKTILDALPIIVFISERRDISKSEKPIFKITAGANEGIRQKWNIICEVIKKNINDLTGKFDIEREVLPGFITDKIEKDSCWAIMDDKNKSENLKIGDRCIISPNIRKLI